MADAPPPVDWSTVQVKSDLGGVSRFPAEAVLKPTAWTCPSCGVENVSVFEYGCPTCHAGEPGKHVGVDPITPKQDTKALSTFIEDLFAVWLPKYKEMYPEHYARGGDATLRAAFVAGYSQGQRNMLTAQTDLQAVVREFSPTPTGPARRAIITTPTLAETVLAAVRFFRQDFLAGLTAADREMWASDAEIDDLLRALEQITND